MNDKLSLLALLLCLSSVYDYHCDIEKPVILKYSFLITTRFLFRLQIWLYVLLYKINSLYSIFLSPTKNLLINYLFLIFWNHVITIWILEVIRKYRIMILFFSMWNDRVLQHFISCTFETLFVQIMPQNLSFVTTNFRILRDRMVVFLFQELSSLI